MRRESAKYFATVVTQFERKSGGPAWDNPDNALAVNGNIGATISNIPHHTDDHHPFGYNGDASEYRYSWVPSSNSSDAPIDSTNIASTVVSDLQLAGKPIPVDPTIPPAPNSIPHSLPNVLRFSGFNINEVGISAADKVVNLYVYVEYSDDSLIDGYSSVQHGLRNYSNWLVVAKGGQSEGRRKRFDGLGSTTGRVIEKVRIPCMRDQSWGTDTCGPGIGFETNSYLFPAQRFRPAVAEWINTPDNYGNHYKNEYYEDTTKIQPLTVGEINGNDGPWWVDIWFGRHRRSSGTVKIHSVAISVEYVKSSSCMAILYCSGSHYSDHQKAIRTLKFNANSRAWSDPWRGVHPDASTTSNGIQVIGNNDTYIDCFADPTPIVNTGSVNDQLRRFDTDMLIGRLDAIPTIDDTQQVVNDIVIDVRKNGYVHTLTNFYNIPRVRWNYFLMDGVNQTDAGTIAEPIHTHKLHLFEPGVRLNESQPGQNWMRHTGGYNVVEGEYYGNQDNWYFHHQPCRRYNPNYCSESVNTISFPGLAYDSLWIEKALKQGRLFLGVVLSIDPGTNHYHNIYPRPKWWIRINSIRVRVYYSCAGGGSEQPVSGTSGLLVRHAP